MRLRSTRARDLLRRSVDALTANSLHLCRPLPNRAAQTCLRGVSFVVRRFPDRRLKLSYVRSALVLEDRRFDFDFHCPSLDIVWSSAGFPDLLTRHLLFEGTYQQEVLAALRALAPPTGVVYDIGGHHGLMTVVSARAVGPEGKVITFEPNPHARRHLEHHVALNSLTNVHLESSAVSDVNGESEFFVQTGIVTWNSTLVRGFARSAAFTEVVRVPVTTIDEFVAASRWKPDVIKIDVEGSELAILRGSTRTLREHRPAVIMELNPVSARAAGHSIDDYVMLLKDLDYDIWAISRLRVTDGRHRGAERFDAALHMPQNELVNVACTPRRRA